MNTTQSIAPAMSLDDAVEAMSVAISLGMDVPAVEGMLVWTAELEGRSDEPTTWDIKVENCASEALAVENLRNGMIHRILVRFHKDLTSPRFLTALKGRTLEDYITNTPTVEMIDDYKHLFNMNFYLFSDRILTSVPQPITPEAAYSRRDKHVEIEI